MIATLQRKPLGQLLLGKGLIKPEQLERALEEQRRSNHQKLLGEILVELRMCTEDQITETLAQAYGVPYARVTPRIADPKVIAALPKEFLEKHQVLPLFLVEGTLTVAVPEPANVFLLEEIERLSGYPVQVVAATVRDIRSTLQAYLPDDKVFVIDDIIEEVRPEEFTLVEAAAKKVQDIADLEQMAGDSPVVKLVNYCIYNAVKDGASDVHIEPGDGYLRVRYRVDGVLVEKLRPPFQMGPAVISRLKIMAGMDISERRLPQDGGIHVMMDKRPIDLRVSTMPGKHGEKVVVRVIDNDKTAVNLEKIGFGYETLKQWRKLINLPNGIVLVTGPTGSGKSTTLYASLAELNADDVNICTIEDPVEYALVGVNQFQVNEKAGFTFASALRSLLRQDPDIIMVGEVRDAETARLATQAALTGHLVLSTLHTNDAPGAVTRLFNLGIEPYLVGATVAGVLAQRLVRKLCPNCREAYDPTPNERRQLERFVTDVQQLYRPKGCPRCNNLGFTGRIGIYELLAPDDAMIERISQGATLNEVRESAKAFGMKTLRADGVEKVKAGITTLEEVYKATT
jgi:type IV pilus assembly protein PilB